MAGLLQTVIKERLLRSWNSMMKILCIEDNPTSFNDNFLGLGFFWPLHFQIQEGSGVLLRKRR